MAEAAGAKKTRRRPKQPTVTPEDDCTTCSICQSKLVMFSNINKHRLNSHLQTGRVFASSNLQCSACGSSLCHLGNLPKS